ncbi:hypothetical protein F511_18046 [Dorcoceras hygrometricum]|uniref:Uncharacterized protein n=1 Tax=Dorcoceras hygrometricum TaxID=472368 RepID=A0A2Z7D0E8_9LAMI|nr:hypothetical protein F511_18046 [Dorcoceras hygrometricum]
MTSGELPTTNGVSNMEEASPADPIVPVRLTHEEKDKKKTKKKSGAFGLFKAALSMMRKRPKDPVSYDKSAPTPNGNWTKLVDSVRPLHSQENIPSPPPSITSEYSAGESLKEMVPPDSPAPSSSAGTMSQYASAASLRDLVDSSDDEEEDPDEVFDALCGDEMIDAKAEEFIAQFYLQLRLQSKGNH